MAESKTEKKHSNLNDFFTSISDKEIVETSPSKISLSSSEGNLSNLSDDIKTPIIENKVSKLSNDDSPIEQETIYKTIDEIRPLKSEEKQLLLNNLRDLTKTQYYYIYKLIKGDTDKYRINTTGVYVSTEILSDNIQREIYNYLIVINENKKKHMSKEDFIHQNIETTLSSIDLNYNNSIKLSNHERAIIKKNKYLQDQKEFKRNSSVKKKVKKKRGRKSSNTSTLSTTTTISNSSKKSTL